MALIATVGASNATCYPTLEEAEAYFADRVHSESWSTATNKEELLITASMMIDWYAKFKGTVASSTQSMKWPRVDVVRPDGSSVASDIIPHDVKVATFEMALALSLEDTSLDNDLAGLSHVQAGPLLIKTAQGPRPVAKTPLPDRVKSILRDLTLTGARIGRLVRA